MVGWIFNYVSEKDSSGACRVAWLNHQDLQDMDKTNLAGLLKCVVFSWKWGVNALIWQLMCFFGQTKLLCITYIYIY